jgi:ATP-binding cassette subfamily F protein 3
MGHFAQGHADLVAEKTVLETILDAAKLKVSQARDLLGRYRFSDDDVFKRIGDLSGGEQARVALATLLLQKANTLILDEPTNHLDIPSQEVLQEALAEFDGTLLLVTHDRYLIRRLATRVWAIEDGQLWKFREGYEAYRDWERQRSQEKQALQRGRYPDPAEGRREIQDKGERGRTREAHKALKRERARRVRRQGELEEEIHKLERRRAQLGAQLAAASEQQAIERVRQLGTEYSLVEAELNALLVVWTDAV